MKRRNNEILKKKHKVEIFKLEERVLFDGAAAAEIADAVNNADKPQDAQNEPESSGKDEEQALIRTAVAAAGPVATPDADTTVQTLGQGLDSADTASQDPVEALITGGGDFSAVTAEVAGEVSGDVADFLNTAVSGDQNDQGDLAVADLSAQNDQELIVIDSDAVNEVELKELSSDHVLILDGESDAGDQINAWLDAHDDESISSVKFVSGDHDANGDADYDADAHTLDADDLGEIQNRLGEDGSIDTLSVDDFNASQNEAEHDMVVFPDSKTQISVEDGSFNPDADLVPDTLLSEADSERHELVIVNSSMADLDNVLAQLGDSREVLVLDASSSDSALEQITDYLTEHSGVQYDAVHLLTHGSDSGVVLGSEYITDAESFSVFNGHIAADGDLMIYGCNMAGSQMGQHFLNNIADVTGADVAASSNITGSAALGGDWNLEYNTGAIETTTISLDSTWEYRLATITVDSTKAASATNAVSLSDALYGWDYVDGETTKHATGAVSGDSITITNDSDTSTTVTIKTDNLTITAADTISYTKITVNGVNVTWSGGTIGTLKSSNASGSFSLSGSTTLEGSFGSSSKSFTVQAGTSDLALTIANGTIMNNSSVSSKTLVIEGTTSTFTDTAFTFYSLGKGQDNEIKPIEGGTFTMNNGKTIFTVVGDDLGNYGNLTITGGTFKGSKATGTAISFEGNKLSIEGGTFSSFATTADVSRGAVAISGGTFTGTVDSTADHGYKGTGISVNSSTSTLTISGGDFTNFDEAVYNTGVAKISGGSFTKNFTGIHNASGGKLTIEQDADNPQTITIQDNGKTGSVKVEDLFAPIYYKTDGYGILNDGTIEKIGLLGAEITNNYYGIYNRGTSTNPAVINDFGDENGTIVITDNDNSGLYNSSTGEIATGQNADGDYYHFQNVALTDNGAIVNDKFEAETGGGLYNAGTIGNINNITITGNKAEQGGGLYNSGKIAAGTAYSDSGDITINENSANYGGGIYWGSSSYLNASMITESSMSGNTAWQGGAIYFASGANVLLQNMSFSSNSAEAIEGIKYTYSVGSDYTQSNYYSSGDSYNRGGAIYVDSGADVTIMYSTFTGNSADTLSFSDLNYSKIQYGTGGYVYDKYVDHGGEGGAIYNEGTLRIVATEFSSNEAVMGNENLQAPRYDLYLSGLAKGGAVYSKGSLTVEDSYFHENTAGYDENDNMVGGFGGAVYIDSASTNATFSSTQAMDGVTDYWGVDGQTNSMIFADNEAVGASDGTEYAGGGFGGAVYVDSRADASFHSVTMTGNTAVLTVTNDGETTYEIGRGGGLYFGQAWAYRASIYSSSYLSTGSGTLSIDEPVMDESAWGDNLALRATNLRASEIYDNTAALGGGLWTDTAGTVTINNTNIYENNAKTDADTLVFDNSNEAGDFFAVFFDNAEQSRLSGWDKVIKEQVAIAGRLFTASGTGMYAGGQGTVTVENVSIYGNNSVLDDDETAVEVLGGGLHVTGDVYGTKTRILNLINTTIYGNTAAAGGGVYIADRADVSVLDSTIALNKVLNENQGGGIYIVGAESSVGIVNSIVVGNQDSAANNTDVASEYSESTIYDRYSIFGTILVKNTATHQFETYSSDPTSNTGVSAEDILVSTVAAESALFYTSMTAETNPGSVTVAGRTYSPAAKADYSKVYTNTTTGKTYYYKYTYNNTNALAIKSDAIAAYKGVYGAIDKTSGEMYYYTLNSKTVAAGETTGTWMLVSKSGNYENDTAASGEQQKAMYIIEDGQNGKSRYTGSTTSSSYKTYDAATSVSYNTYNIGAYQLSVMDVYYYDLAATDKNDGHTRDYGYDFTADTTVQANKDYYYKDTNNDYVKYTIITEGTAGEHELKVGDTINSGTKAVFNVASDYGFTADETVQENKDYYYYDSVNERYVKYTVIPATEETVEDDELRVGDTIDNAYASAKKAYEPNGYKTYTTSGEYYTRVIVNTAEDMVNPYDSKVSFREAILLAGNTMAFNYTIDESIYGKDEGAIAISEKFHFNTGDIVFDESLADDDGNLTISLGDSNVYGKAAGGESLTWSFYDTIGISKDLEDANKNEVSYRIVAGTVDENSYEGVETPEGLDPFVYTPNATAVNLTLEVNEDANGGAGRYRVFDVLSGDITLYSDAEDGSFTIHGGNVSNDNNLSRVSEYRVSESEANYGGAIWLEGSNTELTLQNVTVSDGDYEDSNTANKGGAIYVKSGTLNLIGTTTIEDGTAHGYLNATDDVYKSGQGGAIYVNKDYYEYTADTTVQEDKDYYYYDDDGKYKKYTVITTGTPTTGQLLLGAEIDNKKNPVFEYFSGTLNIGRDINGLKNGQSFVESNITIRESEAAYEGGGIYLAKGSTMIGNRSYYGADGSTEVDESFLVTGNEAVKGAGIYAAGTVTLDRAEITDNTLVMGIAPDKTKPYTDIPVSQGGGLYVSGTATLYGVTVSGNTTDDSELEEGRGPNDKDYIVSEGGGIYAAGTVTIEASELATSAGGAGTDVVESSIGGDNANSAVRGGGVYVASGTFTMEDGSITGNTANLSVAHTTFTGEKAADTNVGQGGGVYVASSATANLTGVELSDNEAVFVTSLNTGITTEKNLSGRGGAVYNEGTVTLTDAPLTGNTAANGGAVYNTAANGGAVYNTGSVTLGVSKDATVDFGISDNSATYSGGAVYNEGTVTFTASETASLEVSGNEAGVNGGAFYNAEGGTVSLTGSTISGNTAGESGGAVYNEGTKFTLTDSSLLNNTATAGNGGAVYNEGTFTFTSDAPSKTTSFISSNTADENGGALYNNADGTMNIAYTLMNANSATQGAALYLAGGTVNLSALTVTGSTATAATDGFAIYAAAGTLNMSNITVAMNSSKGFYGTNLATVTAKNSIFVGNASNSSQDNWKGKSIPEGNLIGNETAGITVEEVFGSDTPELKNNYYYELNWTSEHVTGSKVANWDKSYLDQKGTNRDGLSVIYMGAVEKEGGVIGSNVVTTSMDVVDEWDGVTSLREAITYVQSIGGGTVYFDGDALKAEAKSTSVTITLESGTGYGALALAGGIAILGRDDAYNPDTVSITISGNDTTGIFSVSGENNKISNLTLVDGSNVNGGAIYNTGTLTVSNSTIKSNNSSLTVSNGAIYNTGTLTVTNTEISSNNGGIYTTTDALTLTSVTMSGNTGADVTFDTTAVTAGGALTFLGTSTLDKASFANVATITIGDENAETSDSLNINGENASLVLSGNTSLTVNTGASVNTVSAQNGKELTNNGTIGNLTVTQGDGNENFTLSGSGTVTVLNTTNTDDITFTTENATETTTGTVIGTWNVKGTGNVTLSESSTALTNGSVNVNGGTLTLSGDMTIGNGLTLNGGLLVINTNGTLNGTIVISAATASTEDAEVTNSGAIGGTITVNAENAVISNTGAGTINEIVLNAASTVNNSSTANPGITTITVNADSSINNSGTISEVRNYAEITFAGIDDTVGTVNDLYIYQGSSYSGEQNILNIHVGEDITLIGDYTFDTEIQVDGFTLTIGDGTTATDVKFNSGLSLDEGWLIVNANAQVGGNITVDAATASAEDVEITNRGTINGTITVTENAADTVISNTNAGTINEITLNAASSVNNSSTANPGITKITVNAASSIANTGRVGTVEADNNTAFTGNGTVNTLNAAADITVSGTQTITTLTNAGNLNLGGTLTVTGMTLTPGLLTIADGTISFTNGLTLNGGTLAVNADSTLNGAITVSAATVATTDAEISNAGTITGMITVSAANAVISNTATGTVNGIILNAADTVNNSGTITGAITVNAENAVINNTGAGTINEITLNAAGTVNNSSTANPGIAAITVNVDSSINNSGTISTVYNYAKITFAGLGGIIGTVNDLYLYTGSSHTGDQNILNIHVVGDVTLIGEYTFENLFVVNGYTLTIGDGTTATNVTFNEGLSLNKGWLVVNANAQVNGSITVDAATASTSDAEIINRGTINNPITVTENAANTKIVNDSTITAVTANANTAFSGSGKVTTVTAGAVMLSGEQKIGTLKLSGESLTLSGKVGNGFTIDSSAVSKATLTIENKATFERLSVDSGHVTVGSGANLTVNSGSFSNNSVTGNGGAIDIGSNATVAISNATFSKNTATVNGGAINAGQYADVTLNNVTFSSNSVADSTNGHGGAINLGQGAVLSVTNGSFEENVAAGNGGAINAGRYADVTLNNVTFSKNSTTTTIAAGTRGNGGAINMDKYGLLTVKNGTSFSDNTAANNGGAVNVDQYVNMIVTDSTFSSNIAKGNGGAVYVDNNAAMTANGTSSFTKNSAVSGGAIYVGTGATVNLEGDDVTSGDYTLQFRENAASSLGGAIQNTGTLNVNNVLFYKNNNTATGTGGGAINSNKTLNIGNAKFSSNTSASGGGAIDINIGTAKFTGNVEFTGNSAPRGGAVEIGNGQGTATSLTILSGSNVTFNTNTATTGNGGAIYFDSTSPDTLTVQENAQVAFTGNSATTGNGGAIYLDGTFTNAGTLTFSGNSAKTGDGGAIYANKNLTLSGSANFSRNSAVNGGAIYGIGTVSVSNGTFENNSATTNGGAIYAGSTLSLSGTSSFTGNRAGTSNSTGNGGAIYGVGTVSINDGTFSGNSATGDGGAIYATKNLTLTGTNSFTGNSAVNGGAIYGIGTVSVSNGTFENNSATTNGGAIYATSTLTLTGTISFTGNRAGTSNSTGNGGAIYANTDLTLTGTSNFTGNSATGNGGAIYSTGAVSVTDGTFENNSVSGDGGAIYAGGNVTVNNGTFTGNKANGEAEKDNKGGAIYVGGNLTLTDGSFTNNSVSGKDSQGGAIYVGGNATISGGTFTSNHGGNSGSQGGAVYIAGSGASSINNVTATQNFAIAGGAFYLAAGTYNIANLGDVEFSQNSGFVGGAIYIAKGVSVTFGDKNIVMNDNKVNAGTQRTTKTVSGAKGGAIYNEGTLSMVRDETSGLTFSGNTATGKEVSDTGLGGFLYNAGTATLAYITLDSNTATGAGGAIYSAGTSLTLTGMEFSNNTVTGHADSLGEGGAVAVVSGDLSISGSDFVNNSARATDIVTGYENGKGGAVYFSGTGDLTITGTSFTENIAAHGGAVYVNANGGTVSINDVSVENNKTIYSGTPGVIDETYADVEDEENSASEKWVSQGAGFWFGGNGVVTVENVTFNGNTQDTSDGSTDYTRGGAIYARDSKLILNVINTTIYDNEANHGSALYAYNATVNMVNTTVAMNNATDTLSSGLGGGAILATGSSKLYILNSIVAGNTLKGVEGYDIVFKTDTALNNSRIGYSVLGTTNLSYDHETYVQLYGSTNSYNWTAEEVFQQDDNGEYIFEQGMEWDRRYEIEVEGETRVVYVNPHYATQKTLLIRTDSDAAYKGVYAAIDRTTGTMYFNAVNSASVNDVSNISSYWYNFSTLEQATVSSSQIISNGQNNVDRRQQLSYNVYNVGAHALMVMDADYYAGADYEYDISHNYLTDENGITRSYQLDEIRVTKSTVDNSSYFYDAFNPYDGAVTLREAMFLAGTEQSRSFVSEQPDVQSLYETFKFYYDDTLTGEKRATIVFNTDADYVGSVYAEKHGSTASQFLPDTADQDYSSLKVSSYYGALETYHDVNLTLSGVDQNGVSLDSAIWSEGSSAFKVTQGTLTIQDFSAIMGVGEGSVKASTIEVTGGTLNVLNVESITDGYALNGGAFYISGGEVTLENVTVSGNEAGNGGAFYITGGTLTIGGTSEISGNEAGNGGAFYIASGVTVDIGTAETDVVTIADNRAVYNGGAFYNAGTLTLGNGVVALNGNIAGGEYAGEEYVGMGGAIYNTGTLTIDGNRLNASGNTATGLEEEESYGGFLYNTGIAILTNLMLAGNSATNGGAIASNGGTVTLSEVSMTNNTASVNGGAVSVTGSTLLNVVNSTIYKNNAETGGGIYAAGTAKVSIVDSTIAGNGTYGIYTASSNTMYVLNSIVTGNTEYDVYTKTANKINMQYSILGNGWNGSAEYQFAADGTVYQAGFDDIFVSDELTEYGTLEIKSGSKAAYLGVLSAIDTETGKLYLNKTTSRDSGTIADLSAAEAQWVDMSGEAATPDESMIITEGANGVSRISDLALATYNIGAHTLEAKALATDLVVRTESDNFNPFDDTLSIREAIYLADTEAAGGNYLITFANDVNTITLDAVYGALQFVTGKYTDGEYAGGRQIELNGSGRVSIDGSAVEGVAYVGNGYTDLDAGKQGSVTFRNFDTLTGGSGFGITTEKTTYVTTKDSSGKETTVPVVTSSTKYYGGTFLVKDGSLTIENANYILGGAGSEQGSQISYGGVFAVMDGSLTVTGEKTLISQGSASEMGGMLYQTGSSSEVSLGEYNGNIIIDGRGDYFTTKTGAVIYQTGGKTTLTNVAVTNTGSTTSDALFDLSGELNLVNTSVYENAGKAVFGLFEPATSETKDPVFSGTLNIVDSSIVRNGKTQVLDTQGSAKRDASTGDYVYEYTADFFWSDNTTATETTVTTTTVDDEGNTVETTETVSNYTPSGYLNILNSIVAMDAKLDSTQVTVTAFSSLTGTDAASAFAYDANGNLQIHESGAVMTAYGKGATSGGVLASIYEDGNGNTKLAYRTSETDTWKNLDGTSVDAYLMKTAQYGEVAWSQNLSHRYYGLNTYAIGAYSRAYEDMISGESIVVTISEDVVDNNALDVSLREASMIAASRYSDTGKVFTVTFAEPLSAVVLDSTLKLNTPVTIDGGNDITVSGSTSGITLFNVTNKTGVVTIQNITLDGTGSNRILQVSGNAAVNNSTLKNGSAEQGAAVYVTGNYADDTFTVYSGNKASEGAAVYAAHNITVNGNVRNNTAENSVVYANGNLTVNGNVSGNEAVNVIRAAGDVTVNGAVSDNRSGTGSLVSGSDVVVNGAFSGNSAETLISAASDAIVNGSVINNTAATVIHAADTVLVNGSVSGNTASGNLISGSDVIVSGSISGNSAVDLISATDDVTILAAGSVSGNTASGDVISGSDVIALGDILENSGLNIITADNVSVEGTVSGNTAEEIVIRGSTASVTGTVSGNTSRSGDIIRAGSVYVSATVNDNTASDGVILSGFNVNVRDSFLNDNHAESVITGNNVLLINSTVGGNETAGSVVYADNTTILNTTIVGNPADADSAVVTAGNARIVNSVIVADDADTTGVNALSIDAAYSVFSGDTVITGTDDHNVTGVSTDDVFSGRDAAGNYLIPVDSPAAIGVWVTYDDATGEINYSVRPEGLWTTAYKAYYMDWKNLDGGAGVYVASDLLTLPGLYPSIGSYSAGLWYMHPDFGPGVNSDLEEIFGGLAGGMLTVADSFDWYQNQYRYLFGGFAGEAEGLSVSSDLYDVGSVPDGEDTILKSLTVQNILEEDTEEFIEEPYYEDGTRLTNDELNAIRKATLLNEVPEESVALSEEVSEDVASSMRSADIFKDDFDKALEELLGV